jgi:hypothetical protein
MHMRFAMSIPAYLPTLVSDGSRRKKYLGRILAEEVISSYREEGDKRAGA